MTPAERGGIIDLANELATVCLRYNSRIAVHNSMTVVGLSTKKAILHDVQEKRYSSIAALQGGA